MPCRLGLDHASSISSAVVGDDLSLEGRSGVGGHRVVGQWDIGQALNPCSALGEDAIDEWRSCGLDGDDGFDEVGDDICDDPGHETTL